MAICHQFSGTLELANELAIPREECVIEIPFAGGDQAIGTDLTAKSAADDHTPLGQLKGGERPSGGQLLDCLGYLWRLIRGAVIGEQRRAETWHKPSRRHKQ
jgi:hypothetical protein